MKRRRQEGQKAIDGTRHKEHDAITIRKHQASTSRRTRGGGEDRYKNREQASVQAGQANTKALKTKKYTHMGVFFHFRRLCSLILHVHENAPTLYGALSALFDAGRCGRTKPSFSGFCPPPLPPPHPSDSTGAQRSPQPSKTSANACFRGYLPITITTAHQMATCINRHPRNECECSICACFEGTRLSAPTLFTPF